MSKKKRSYIDNGLNYYQDQNRLPYNNLLVNYNNIVDLLNNIDMNNLKNAISMIFNGNDINKFNFNEGNTEVNSIDIYNRNEVIINFFSCLKVVLRQEFCDVIDRFIEFYMDEINKER